VRLTEFKRNDTEIWQCGNSKCKYFSFFILSAQLGIKKIFVPIKGQRIIRFEANIQVKTFDSVISFSLSVKSLSKLF